jgi:transposase
VTGEVTPGHLFVVVLGASNLTYAEVHPAQDLASYIGGHVRAFAYFGGVPALLVPDNLRSAVTKADRYEPRLNRSYQEMASHYGTAVLPARPYKPRDKPKVEVGVQIAERWILAVLRKRTFFSVAEANTAVSECLERLNDHPFQKLEGSRRSLFAATDQRALKPLPQPPYEFALWRLARVHIDCHVEYERCFYSVPHALVGQQVDLRLAERVVTIYHKSVEVARHTRCAYPGERKTVVEHLPKAHQKHLEWTPERLMNWGRSVGRNTGILVERILQDKPHPEMGYRSCLGILSLSKKYSAERLESAARRALDLGAPTYRSVQSILEKGLDRLPAPPPDEEVTPLQHRNIRGSQYYKGRGSR